MEQFITYVLVYAVCFVLAMYGVSSINFNGMIKKNHVYQAQVLYLLIVVAIAYLVSNAILSLMYFMVK